MKRKSSAQSAIFNLRTLTACTFFSVASLLTYFSLAASARPVHKLIFNGTLTPTGLTTTITVNSTSPVIANDGMCTLPEAIIAANTQTASGSLPGECPAGTSGGNIIVLASGATYTLPAPQNSMYGPNGLPAVTSPIAMVGNGAIIERNSNSPTNFRLFYISPAGSLSLNNLTMRNGIAKGGDGGEGVGGGGGLGAGGAIYNQGGLSLNGVTLTANKASGGNGGNGILGQGAGGGGMGGNGGQTTSGGGFPGCSGGGGMGGNGGDSTGPGGGGGGGLNLTDAGQPGVGPVGGAGGGTTGGAGGNGANLTTSGGNALGVGGGGGGAGNPVAFVVPVANGGNGAIGGGGGGCIVGDAPRVASCQGGQGGFGGGGGSGGRGISGNGGFGGGGGGASAPTGGTAAPGNGGFGGGKGSFDGGGGAGMGGAIFNDTGVVTTTNSTLTGNTAAGGSNGSGLSASVAGDGLGGAIFNLNGSVTVDFSTIVSNTVTGGARGPGGAGTVGLARGGAIYNYTNAGSAPFSVRNSIIANSVGAASDCINDPGATLTSNGYNLVRTPSATCGFAATGDLTGVNPMLAALADNGGPTQTQALQAGSQAIDRIPNGINGCQSGVSVDQRGAPRAGGPGMGGTACDSGAYEVDSLPPQNLGGPPGPPTFGHPIISGVGGYGFEEDIRLDPTDPNIVYTSAPDSLSSNTSWIWHSRDGGKTFKWITSGSPFLGKPTLAPCAGGGDSELGVDSAGHLYFNDLTLANFTVARSDDKGVTLPCNNTGVPDTAVDRQWYATDGDPVNGGGSLYLVNDEIGPGGAQCPNSTAPNNVLVMYRSPANGVGATAGLLFGPANKITANLSCDEGIMGNDEVSPVPTTTGQPNGLGGFAVLPAAVKHIYVIHDDGNLHQIQIGRCFPVAFGQPVANVSDPSGLNCTNILVAELGTTGVRTGANFPTMAIDKAGNLYAVWEQAPATTVPDPMNPGSFIITVTGDTVLKYSYSTDEGNTWSTPMQIDTSGSSAGTLHNNVFAWIGAGDDGRVDIAWYGTPNVASGTKGPDSCTSCYWSLWMVQSLNAHAATPTFTAPILASEHFSHLGSMYTLIGGQTGNRTLGDFLQMRIGPFGEAQISYADSNSINEALTPHAMYVRQNGGNGVFAASSPLGIAGLTPFNSVTDPLGDGKYEVNGMTSANMPQLDIIGSSVSLLTTAPCSTATPCYQVVMQLNNLSLAPTTAQDPNPDLVWLTQWFVPSSTDPNGGKNFFVYAESAPPTNAALTCYSGEAAALPNGGGVLITYPGAVTLPAANCLSTLGPNGTITIDVPLSNVNEAGAIDNHLHEVTASTMTLNQPANAVPSTAGLGGVLFNLIDVAQGYTFVPTPPLPVSVVSRMTHGGAGTFDVNLPLPPNSSPRGVECRSSSTLGAGNYQLVFTFTANLTSVASASVSSGTGSVSGSPIVSGNTCTVNLTGVTTAQYITVTLNNVVDATGATGNIISPQLGILVGDVNANGVVSNTDVSLVKGQVTAPVGPTNFREDVNANGVISNTDVSVTKAQVTATLPSPP